MPSIWRRWLVIWLCLLCVQNYLSALTFHVLNLSPAKLYMLPIPKKFLCKINWLYIFYFILTLWILIYDPPILRVSLDHVSNRPPARCLNRPSSGIPENFTSIRLDSSYLRVVTSMQLQTEAWNEFPKVIVPPIAYHALTYSNTMLYPIWEW